MTRDNELQFIDSEDNARSLNPKLSGRMYFLIGNTQISIRIPA